MASMNANVSYGRALLDMAAAACPTFGNVFVVVNTSDAADPNYLNLAEVFKTDFNGQVRLFTDLQTAYDNTTTNNDDVILLTAHTSHKVSAMLTISKSRIHFVGMDGGGRWSNQRTLISNTGAGAATDVSMVKNTGTGNTFKNIAFKNNWTVAQNLSAVLEYGNNPLYKNCSFQNLGSAHLTNANAAPLILAAGDAEFHECNIGSDTLQSTAASGQYLLIKKGTSAQAATRCLFEKCIFRAYTSQTTTAFVRVAAEGDIDRDITFKDCSMLNFNTVNNGALMAVAVAASATMDGGNMYFDACRSFGTTDFATAAVGNTGLLVCGGTAPTAGSDGVAVKPTA